jgi:hypothetical protein
LGGFLFIWIFASYRNTLYEALEKIGEDQAKAITSYVEAKFESKKKFPLLPRVI